MSFFKFLIITAALNILSSCSSQHKASKIQVTKTDTSENSLIWISMIDSPGVNYFEVVAAFDKYWEHRQKPTEVDGEGQDIFKKDYNEETKGRDSDSAIQYVYEYKRFLNWQQRNKNLVKPDGTVMTSDEILEQWKKMKNDSLNR